MTAVNSDIARRRATALAEGGRSYQRKRAALLSAAAKVFREKGYRGATLNDIAAELGTERGSLYYYVSGKDDLVFQAHLQAVERTASFFQMADETGKNGLEKIEIYLRTEIGNEWGATTILSEAVYLDEERRRIIQRKGQENEETFRRFVAEGIADGSISPNSKKLVELAIKRHEDRKRNRTDR